MALSFTPQTKRSLIISSNVPPKLQYSESERTLVSVKLTALKISDFQK